ncbi:DUF4126 family protein [uncultured Sphingomonas sp.]|uniref:DUF4126 family protein n=1 Tax=uncultured Sphingomonas sp. TaxID=158754 RepID=UPI0035CB731D
MLASFLMGLVGGQRAMTPLATVYIAAARGELPDHNARTPFLGTKWAAAGATLLAVAELAGDKQKTAPDRIVAVGLLARFTTSAIAGMALAPKRQRWLGAAVGGATAVLASYPGWRARMAALARFGQTSTGFVEDAAVIAGAATIVRTLPKAA